MILKRLTPEQLALLTDAERAAYARHAPDVNDPNDLGCCVACGDLWPCSLHDAYAAIAELRAALENTRDELEAEQDIRHGRTRTFDNVDDAVDWLNSEEVEVAANPSAIVSVRFDGQDFDVVSRAAEAQVVFTTQFIHDAALEKARTLAEGKEGA